MLTSFDDYCIHQTTEPLAQPISAERNFYDRYWFNGFDADGSFFFEAALGIYPNRHVMDAHFSVVIEGKQYSFHASRRAPFDRTQTHIGPLKVEVLEPMRRIRYVIDKNEHGIECDLVFYARTAPVQEDKNIMREGVRIIMETSRFTQYGMWEGHITVKGKRIEVKKETAYGTRDKSWGYRPIGEPEAGAPGLLNKEPGVYWFWTPIHFKDFCTHYATFQDFDGNPTQEGGAIIPAYKHYQDIPEQEQRIEHIKTCGHQVQWIQGTRWPKSSSEFLVDKNGLRYELELTPTVRFIIMGIGYHHAEWGHAFWKGEEAFGYEEWTLADLDPLDYRHIHVHHIARATLKKGNETFEGIGTLETICFGRHPSGFKDILDGAA